MNPSCIRTDRWRPPKPLVGQRVLEKVLNRHTAVSCPESRLFVAVISAAIVDCLSLGKGVRREARRFLLGDDHGIAPVEHDELVRLPRGFGKFAHDAHQTLAVLKKSAFGQFQFQQFQRDVVQANDRQHILHQRFLGQMRP